jgi:hypothetical protein
MALRKYRYRKNGNEYGPVDESVMRTLVASGEIAPEDEVWSEEKKIWAVATDFFVFPKKRIAYQVPPQLAHPPTKLEQARPWLYVLGGVLFLCAVVLIWAIQHDRPEPPQQVPVVAASTALSASKKKPLTAVDRAIEEMKQVAVPKAYEELVAALETPPAPPAQFDRPSELVRWWSAYSQLHDRYWNALTEVQQQRIASDVREKWRAPWKSSRFFVKEVRGDVREVRSAVKTADIPSDKFYVELTEGSLAHCILYSTEDEVARISKGAPFQAQNVRVIKIVEDKISRLFPEDRQVTIWYESERQNSESRTQNSE